MFVEQLKKMESNLVADIATLTSVSPFALMDPHSEASKLAVTLAAVRRAIATKAHP